MYKILKIFSFGGHLLQSGQLTSTMAVIYHL